MAWVGVAIAGSAAIYKGVTGAIQSAKANKMNPINPGYQVNQGVIDNARTLGDQYNNYQLPGYGAIAGNINTNFSNAFNEGAKGASSGNDILGLATKIAYGKNQAFNQLGEENAQGKQSMLADYLNANTAAGQEGVNKNTYDRQQYEQQLRQKAALTQAGAQNTYGAVDQLAGIAAKYDFSTKGNTSKTTTPSYYQLTASDPGDPNS